MDIQEETVEKKVAKKKTVPKVKKVTMEAKDIVPEVKMVKVKVTHTFRYNKKECNSKTKTLPEGVANWMVGKRYGKIL